MDWRCLERLVEAYYAGGISRRDFARGALAFGVAVAALPSAVTEILTRPAGAQPLKGSGEVVVCTWGGSYTESQKKAFFDPFETETGIRVRVVGTPDLAKIQAMVQNKAVEWDLVDAESQMMLRLGAQDMLERADFSIIPKTDLMAVSEWGIGSVSYGYVLSWSTKTYPQKEPSTWKDFFDAAAFPGRRAMYAQPMPNLEFALLSDGVALDKLYPLDVDRAFRVLERHKPLINVWYKSTTQIPTLFRGEEVDLMEATGGRVIDLKRSGAPVNFTYNQGAWMQSFWVTPKGAKNKENAMKLMAFYARPENEAQFAQMFANGVPNIKAYALMPKETVALLPTSPENIGKQIRIDAAWWSKNVDEITKRWLGFVG
jgi:putative spermidine/putrescine transport system substrate-binding protein